MRTRIGWYLGLAMITAAYVAGCYGMAYGGQFETFKDWRDPKSILVGHWQSCLERDGNRREWIFDYTVLGRPVFEFHMGPSNEFAVFAGVVDEHRSHRSATNLLQGYIGDLDHQPYHKHWDFRVDHIAYELQVDVAGGSRDACEGGADYPTYSYFVNLRKR